VVLKFVIAFSVAPSVVDEKKINVLFHFDVEGDLLKLGSRLSENNLKPKDPKVHSPVTAN
jgi:hypothetical protein